MQVWKGNSVYICLQGWSCQMEENADSGGSGHLDFDHQHR